MQFCTLFAPRQKDSPSDLFPWDPFHEGGPFPQAPPESEASASLRSLLRENLKNGVGKPTFGLKVNVHQPDLSGTENGKVRSGRAVLPADGTALV